jgi:hypothetical protein
MAQQADEGSRYGRNILAYRSPRRAASRLLLMPQRMFEMALYPPSIALLSFPR